MAPNLKRTLHPFEYRFWSLSCIHNTKRLEMLISAYIYIYIIAIVYRFYINIYTSFFYYIDK